MDCIFCKIIARTADATIVFENERLVVFKDLYPAADFHFLAVPKNHIRDPKCLTIQDKALVEEMRDSLTTVLVEENKVNPEDMLLGFHWPPFNSVKHLHMHGLAPISKMGWFRRSIFFKDCLWFKSTDYVLNDFLPTTAAL